jgi:hypothetical protein
MSSPPKLRVPEYSGRNDPTITITTAQNDNSAAVTRVACQRAGPVVVCASVDIAAG